jgi:hypothetical protein
MTFARPICAAAAAALLLSGCASSGTKVSEQQVQAFQKGTSTRAQVVAALGAPTSTLVQSDGTRIDVYMHIQASANAASFVPIVGLFAGGATGSTDSATFTYDAAGTLQRSTWGHSASDVKTGLLNQ